MEKIAWHFRSKKILFMIIAIILAFAISGYYLYISRPALRSKATGEEATISLTTTRDTENNLNIRVTATPLVSFITQGYILKIRFDPQHLHYNSIQYHLGLRSTPANDNPSSAEPNSPNTTGIIIAQGEIQSGTGQPLTQNSNIDLVTLNFTPLTSASSEVAVLSSDLLDNNTTKFIRLVVNSNGEVTGELNYLTVVGTTITINSDNNITPSTVITATTSQNPTMTLVLRLKFAGILQQPASQFNQLAVRIRARNNSEEETTTATFTADNQGVWEGRASFFTLPAGNNYKLFIKGPKHLQKKFCENNATENEPGTYRCGTGAITLNSGNNSLDFSGVIIPAGDLPENGVQNGVINSYDLAVVRNIYDHSDEERRRPESLAIADLNLDGYVDAQDYSLIIAALSTRVDEED